MKSTKSIKSFVFLVYILILSLLISQAASLQTVQADDVLPVNPYLKELAKFPADYQERLKPIHELYPNYIFIADRTGTDFTDVLNIENTGFAKAVSIYSDGLSWRAMDEENYNWEKGIWYEDPTDWTKVSREVLAFYLDPRSSLDVNDIGRLYQFVEQSYDKTNQTKEILLRQVRGTFLEGTYEYNEEDEVDKLYKGSYADVIMAAAEQSGVNPYVIVATIIQEQGAYGTSPLITGDYAGYEGYYNFFNYAASGSDVVGNGLRYAKEKGWDSVADSIIQGAIRYGEGYIRAGQNTYYYKDFNVINQVYWHQYASAVYDQVSSGYMLARAFQEDRNASLIFRIPVYDNMPEEPCQRPVEDGRLNNYYLLDLQMEGLEGTFSTYDFNYAANVFRDTTIAISLPETASYIGEKTISLDAGTQNINLPVMAESGYTRTYTVEVTAEVPCVLTVTEPIFTDVINDRDYWYTPVFWAYENGITRGYKDGTFRPNEDTTRAEMAIFLWRLAGCESAEAVPVFPDIEGVYSPGSDTYRAVAWAYEKGIIMGFPDGTFKPAQTVNRKDAMIMLYRSLGRPAQEDAEIPFPDAQYTKEKNPDTYAAILWATQTQVTHGYPDGTFGTFTGCCRKDIVTFMYRAARLYEQ